MSQCLYLCFAITNPSLIVISDWPTCKSRPQESTQLFSLRIHARIRRETTDREGRCPSLASIVGGTYLIERYVDHPCAGWHAYIKLLVSSIY